MYDVVRQTVKTMCGLRTVRIAAFIRVIHANNYMGRTEQHIAHFFSATGSADSGFGDG